MSLIREDVLKTELTTERALYLVPTYLISEGRGTENRVEDGINWQGG